MIKRIAAPALAVLGIVSGTHSLSANDEEVIKSVWLSDYGNIYFSQIGKDIEGTYEHENGILKGIIRKGKFIGWWRHDDESWGRDCGPDMDWQGKIIFVFNDNRDSFVGDWARCSTPLSSLRPRPGRWDGELLEGSIKFPPEQELKRDEAHAADAVEPRAEADG